jgi:hypothetical protein
VQAVATAFLLLAIGRRSARWGIVWLPLALIVGVATAATAHWYIDSAGLADDPAPQALWIWIGLTGLPRCCSWAGAAPAGGGAERR